VLTRQSPRRSVTRSSPSLASLSLSSPVFLLIPFSFSSLLSPFFNLLSILSHFLACLCRLLSFFPSHRVCCPSAPYPMIHLSLPALFPFLDLPHPPSQILQGISFDQPLPIPTSLRLGLWVKEGGGGVAGVLPGQAEAGEGDEAPQVGPTACARGGGERKRERKRERREKEREGDEAPQVSSAAVRGGQQCVRKSAKGQGGEGGRGRGRGRGRERRGERERSLSLTFALSPSLRCEGLMQYEGSRSERERAKRGSACGPRLLL
jgi:hypothetical protein